MNAFRGVAVLLALLIASPASAQIELRYWEATASVNNIVAKKVPKDLVGVLAEACNVGYAPAAFNPAWVTLYAENYRVQDSSSVLVAAQMAREDSAWAKVLGVAGKSIAVGTISAAVAIGTSGASIPVEWATGLGIGAALSPKIAKELKDTTEVSKPENLLPMKASPVEQLDAGACQYWAFAAAKGGPSMHKATIPAALLPPTPGLPDPPVEVPPPSPPAVIRTVPQEAAPGAQHSATVIYPFFEAHAIGASQ